VKKILAVFSHYDVDNIIDDYVVYYLLKLKEVVTDIIFVSTSMIGNSDKEKNFRYLF
jgi:lipopolysaccharide biosynthesis protein